MLGAYSSAWSMSQQWFLFIMVIPKIYLFILSETWKQATGETVWWPCHQYLKTDEMNVSQ